MIIHTLLAWLTILAAPAKPYEVKPPDDVFQVAAGTWGWGTGERACAKSPQRVTFTPDHSVMLIESANDSGGMTVTQYTLQWSSPSTIRGLITDETRLTPEGQPVVWDLVLMSPNTFRWHRTDWARGAFTGELTRCPVGKARVQPSSD